VIDKIRIARKIQLNSDANFLVSYYFTGKLNRVMKPEKQKWNEIVKEWLRDNWESVAESLAVLLPKLIPTPLGDSAESAILLFIINLIKKMIKPKEIAELTEYKLHIVEQLKC